MQISCIITFHEIQYYRLLMSSEQAMGGYRCDVCGMTFNSLSDLDTHTREKHRIYATTTWQ